MKADKLEKHLRIKPGARVRVNELDSTRLPSEEFRDLSDEGWSIRASATRRKRNCLRRGGSWLRRNPIATRTA